jgi:hypothetical protein
MNKKLSASEFIKLVKSENEKVSEQHKIISGFLEEQKIDIQNSLTNLRKIICKAGNFTLSNYNDRLKSFWKLYLETELKERIKKLGSPIWYIDSRYTGKDNTLYVSCPNTISAQFIIGPIVAPEVEFQKTEDKYRKKVKQNPSKYEELLVIIYISELSQFNNWKAKINKKYYEYKNLEYYSNEVKNAAKDIILRGRTLLSLGIETEINDIDLNEQVQKFSNKFVGNVDALICIFKSPIFTNKFEIFNEKISIKKGTYRYMGAAFINTLIKYKVIEMKSYIIKEILLYNKEPLSYGHRELDYLIKSQYYSEAKEIFDTALGNLLKRA